MKTKALAETKVARKVMFHRVAENLYRLETSGGYYALVKRGDKQFRRSLKTKDRKLAERRLNELRAQVMNLRVAFASEGCSLSDSLNFRSLPARAEGEPTHLKGFATTLPISGRRSPLNEPMFD